MHKKRSIKNITSDGTFLSCIPSCIRYQSVDKNSHNTFKFTKRHITFPLSVCSIDFVVVRFNRLL